MFEAKLPNGTKRYTNAQIHTHLRSEKNMVLSKGDFMNTLLTDGGMCFIE